MGLPTLRFRGKVVPQTGECLMKIVSDPNLNAGWIAAKIQHPKLEAVFFAKGTWDLKHGEKPVPAGEDDAEHANGDTWFEEDPAKGLHYPNDFAPFKPKTDLLVVGTCHPPGGKAVETATATFHLGKYSKSVAVIGERQWKKALLKSLPTDPAPFQSMPIRYDHAFGGEGFAPNPVGRGFKNDHVPNIENPDKLIGGKGDKPAPAGFGPVPGEWRIPANKVGTYNKAWEKERWPWYPKDFNWSWFNVAPEDQQLDAPLRGDEELRFVNMHPQHSDYKSRLPGVRARCCVLLKDASGEKWEEVPVQIDTMWVDMDQEKLILLWRGRIPVKTVMMEEVDQLFITAEPLDAEPRSAEALREEMEKRLKEDEVEEGEAADLPEEPAFDEDAFDKQFEEMDKEMKKAEEEANKHLETAKKQLQEQGLDPSLLDADPNAATKSIKESQAEITAAFDQMKKDASPEALEQMKDLEPPDLSEFEEMEKERAELEKEMEADAGPEPPTRESVVQGVAEGKNFQGQDLTSLDLSGLNLAGARFVQTRLSKVTLADTNLSKADLRGADFSEADLSGADLSGAFLDEGDGSKARLPGANLTSASLAGTDFSGANLTGANLDGIRGMQADFEGADLSESRFQEAELELADFSGATLSKADFRKAKMKSVCIEEANAQGILMDGADLTGFRASDGPDLKGGSFKQVQAAESTWERANLEGADFTGSNLARADFSHTSLRKALFDRANLKGASFGDASMREAQMLEANLCQSGFERTDLTGAQLVRSNFYEADFWDAVTEGANFEGANLSGTRLAK